MTRAKSKGPVLVRAAITSKRSLPDGSVKLEIEGLTSSAFFDRCSKIAGDVFWLVDPASAKRASQRLYDLGTVSVVRAPKRGRALLEE
jgi:hypothetical protein